jgi:hypothetical protein
LSELRRRCDWGTDVLLSDTPSYGLAPSTAWTEGAAEWYADVKGLLSLLGDREMERRFETAAQNAPSDWPFHPAVSVAMARVFCLQQILIEYERQLG